jgi:hypothetical protein
VPSLSCSEALEDLLDYVEGSLEPSPKQLFAEHVHVCGVCGHILESYLKTQTLCRRLLKKEPPAGLSERLFAVLREKASVRPRT